jgi:CRP-like cAMP-binding protein
MMMTDPRTDALDLLARQVGEEPATVLLERASLIECEQGEVIMQDQGEVDSLYLLLSGRLALSVEMAGHTIQLGEVDTGNWVGEVALFSGSHLAVSRVEAVTAATLLRLPFGAFHSLIQEHPTTACRLTHVLIGMLIQRLRATVNDPILDQDGQLLMLGQLSVPVEAHAGHHGIRDFLKNLLGVR